MIHKIDYRVREYDNKCVVWALMDLSKSLWAIPCWVAIHVGDGIGEAAHWVKKSGYTESQ